MIPAAILSSVALFLPNIDKLKLSRGSLFFDQAMQWHFRLLVNQESNACGAEVPAASMINWRIKYGELQSQMCFSLNNHQLRLDPFDSSGYPEQMPSNAPILSGYKAWHIKQFL